MYSLEKNLTPGKVTHRHLSIPYQLRARTLLSMTPKVHWTHDRRWYRLRNYPAWYRLHSGPLFTPRPSARMEKLAAEERRREWLQQQSAASTCLICNEGCVEVTFCPCLVYSRTSTRLRSALKGWDARGQQSGCVSSECVSFACCLPCMYSDLPFKHVAKPEVLNLEIQSTLSSSQSCKTLCETSTILMEETATIGLPHAAVPVGPC